MCVDGSGFSFGSKGLGKGARPSTGLAVGGHEGPIDCGACGDQQGQRCYILFCGGEVQQGKFSKDKGAIYSFLRGVSAWKAGAGGLERWL